MSSVKFRAALTVLVIVLAIPGLIIEPGPITEALATTIILAIWLDEA